MAEQSDRSNALAQLASGGDDYELALAVAPEDLDAFLTAAPGSTAVGRFAAGQGVEVRFQGAAVAVKRLGWSHD